jgi:transcriptional regulator with XRE-family HTH domain
VHRTLHHFYGQIIDNHSGKVLFSASTLQPKAKDAKSNVVNAAKIGKNIAELATKAGIHLQSLGKLERGGRQRLNQKTKKGLAIALDIPSEYLEAVSQGRGIEASIIKKFCPNCWIPGTQPEQTWTLSRANNCLMCGTSLQKSCTGCDEPFTSFKHKFCSNCGIPYKPKKIPNS